MNLKDMFAAIVEYLHPLPDMRLHEGPDKTGAKIVAVRNGNGGFEVQTVDGPTRKTRNHTFLDIPSFAAWLNRHARNLKGRTEILIYGMFQDKLTGKAALTPTVYGSDVVSLSVPTHPVLQQWKGIWGRTCTQKQLLDALRPLEKTIVGFPDIDHVAPGKYFLQELAKFSARSTSGLNVEYDVMGICRVFGVDEKVEISVRLPIAFIIEIPVFPGVLKIENLPQSDHQPAGIREIPAVYTFDVLVSIELKKDDVPRFTISCPGEQIVVDAAVNDAVIYLDHLLDEGFLVGRGELKTETVTGLPVDLG